jgi:hypothetical protein
MKEKTKELFMIHSLIFSFAFLSNLVWELIHSPLYITNIEIHSFVGALFIMCFRDALIIIFMYWIICLETRTWNWLASLQKHIILISVVGILISYAIEMKNVYFLQLWSYNQYMPIIPILHVGLTPVLQMIVTPIFTFWISKKILKHMSIC